MSVMDQQQLSKVESAVQDCLDECRASHTPFTLLAVWLEKLKSDPAWSDSELREFQLRVVRVLM